MEGLAAGSHLCLIYEAREEQLSALVPYLRAGLERGERCLYIVDEMWAPDIEEALVAAGIDVSGALEAGALVVTDKRETYLRGGKFDPDAMIGFLRDATAEALADGFTALRATGEMTWMLGGEPGTDRLLEYEAKLNQLLSGSAALAICQYHRNRFAPELIRGVLETHPVVIVSGTVLDNDQFVPPEEFLASDRSAREVDWLLNGLVQRNHAARSLRASEARFRSLTENAADAILLVDRDDTITWVSSAVETLFGYAADQVMGRPGLSFVHPDDADRMHDFWQQVLDRPDEPLRPDPFRLQDADGQSHWVEETVTNLLDDAAVGGVVINQRDVTTQHLAEEALRESEERFRRLAHNAQDGVYRLRLRPQVGFEYINPAVSRMTGHTPEEIYANPSMLLHEVIHPEDRDMFAQIANGARDAAAPIQVRWKAPDGSGWISVEERHSIIRDDDGHAIAVEGIVRDITSRIRSEQALRDALARELHAADRLRKLDHMKNTFLTAVSHELRTPLTAIQGFAKLLVTRHRELTEERLEQLLQRLDHNATRLSALLTDLLDLSRLTHGGALEPNLAPAHVDRVVFGVMDELDLQSHPIRCRIEPLSARIDRPKFERIVHNLIANAVRHTPPGTSIWIHLHPDEDGIHLTVEDAGPGVPDDLKPVLFEPFQMGDTPATRTGGAGIGLSLVARFAELHGGRVWVEDRAGGGASFHVSIPHTSQPS